MLTYVTDVTLGTEADPCHMITRAVMKTLTLLFTLVTILTILTRCLAERTDPSWLALTGSRHMIARSVVPTQAIYLATSTM